MADMETNEPDNPSGFRTDEFISPVDGMRHQTTVQNFGIDESHPAREYGRSLAREGLNPGQAEAEIWREAWETYPGRRFFARCFAQESDKSLRSGNKILGCQR
jgi:hypothetical protein